MGGVGGAIAGLSPFKSGPQKAKKAVKKRGKLAKQAVDIFDQQTDKLADAIKASKDANK